jgi:microcystin-dependent protein
MSFIFPPKGWALCNGQLLPINQNQALFSLLGTTYGGNGQTTFALPDLRARVPMHTGSEHPLGEVGGEQAHTLSLQELPTHTHQANATNQPALSDDPSNAVFASAGANVYAPMGGPADMANTMVSNTGGSQAHLNMQPFLILSFCIALQGIFPSQN